MPVGLAPSTTASARLMDCAAVRGVTSAGIASAAARTPSSTMVPQAWHSGQRPTQRIESAPPSEQAKPPDCLRAPFPHGDVFASDALFGGELLPEVVLTASTLPAATDSSGAAK